MAVRSVNKAIILGNLTADPAIKSTTNGTTVATFAVATNRTYTTADGDYQETADFHNIVAFGKLAEICDQLLKIGSKVYVEGRLQTRKWEDQDGKTNYRTEIVAENVILLANGKPYNDNDSNESNTETEKPKDNENQDLNEEVDAEEIPF